MQWITIQERNWRLVDFQHFLVAASGDKIVIGRALATAGFSGIKELNLGICRFNGKRQTFLIDDDVSVFTLQMKQGNCH